jgi:hypothetical protein
LDEEALHISLFEEFRSNPKAFVDGRFEAHRRFDPWPLPKRTHEEKGVVDKQPGES